MDPLPTPNDCWISTLLSKRAMRDSDLELLLWAFAGDNSALDPDKVEAFTNRIDELRRKLLVAYLLGKYPIRIADVWSSQNLTSRQLNMPLRDYGYGFQCDPQTNARRALKFLDADRRSGPFPFLQLPFEIRQQVYSYMLAGTERQLEVVGFLGSMFKVITLSSRNLDEDFRKGGMEIDAAIICTCQQIHDEAEPILYRSHVFAFGSCTSTICRFLWNLSNQARQNIRCISMTFGIYGGRLDRLDRQNFSHWRLACGYIAEHLQLHELIFDLDVPAQSSHFDQNECIRQLRRIKNLKKLTQTRLITPPSDRALLGVRHGAVTALTKQEWLNDMDALLRFLVEHMVRPDCFPQEPIVWR
ncbi:hypothetical protein MMC07_005713 [Pseudocyphellaria aurata]|nr:hypothetical protein [Pseudocyphellaria aurata]